MDKQWLINYGMPKMFHDDLLKGRVVETINGYYKIVNDKLKFKGHKEKSFKEVSL